MPSRFDRYRMQDGLTRLGEAYFNAIWRDIDLRIASLEDLRIAWAEAVRMLTETGLIRINEILAPAFADVTDKAAQVEAMRVAAQALITLLEDRIANAGNDLTAWQHTQEANHQQWQQQTAATQAAAIAGIGVWQTQQINILQAWRNTLESEQSAAIDDIEAWKLLRLQALDAWRNELEGALPTLQQAIAAAYTKSGGEITGDVAITGQLHVTGQAQFPGGISGTLQGKLAVPRLIQGVPFDGSADITLPGGYQEFTTTGTWHKPEGARFVQVLVIGGGGGGLSRTLNASTVNGGGAGGEGVLRTYMASELPSSVICTIGAGGAPSQNGGTSSFGANLHAQGGTGATTAGAGISPGVGTGHGGLPSTTYPGHGHASLLGGGGGGGASGSNLGDVTGNGGASMLGGAGGAAVRSGVGNPGQFPGGGGGAAGGSTAGAGAPGVVRVWCW
ncbi:glycine-rich domain-containing protein [Stutzerimonas kunmingensis]|uniref:glycine-rich domain-containing protein n=1 Tax=Stutzerimonas kunmingensis TaxID=1211807 RepID=UPI0028B22478|nr:hypothetical protein [Stutzerimonas kunmingensis]